jgi:hypothetical protein
MFRERGQSLAPHKRSGIHDHIDSAEAGNGKLDYPLDSSFCGEIRVDRVHDWIRQRNCKWCEWIHVPLVLCPHVRGSVTAHRDDVIHAAEPSTEVSAKRPSGARQYTHTTII